MRRCPVCREFQISYGQFKRFNGRLICGNCFKILNKGIELFELNYNGISCMDLVKLFEEQDLIKNRKGKYYSKCAYEEEITIEINNILSKLGDKGK